MQDQQQQKSKSNSQDYTCTCERQQEEMFPSFVNIPENCRINCMQQGKLPQSYCQILLGALALAPNEEFHLWLQRPMIIKGTNDSESYTLTL
jgi:hypothetical protein